MFSLSIYIPASRSSTYGEVISAAKRTGCYDPASRMLTIESMIQVWRWWNEFTIVFWRSQKWSGFYVTANNQVIIPHNNAIYYILQNIKYCYSSHLSTLDPAFCSDGCFGCRQLLSFPRHVQPGIADYRAWYNCGRFTSATTWEVDRAQILVRLLRESDDNYIRFCPSFDVERVRSAVYALPEVIHIGKYWKVRNRIDVGASGPVMVADGVTYDFEVPVEPEEVDLPKDANVGDIDKYLDDLLRRKKRG